MTDLQRQLVEKNRQIDIYGEVNSELARYVREALLILSVMGSPAITVSITSGGGSADLGLDIYDMLVLYTGYKTGIVIGQAGSMAAVILQACDWRVITPNAEIIIHHIMCNKLSLSILKDENKLQEYIGSKENLYYQYKILSNRTGKSEECIMATCDKDTPMDAKRSLDYGLVDQIISHLSEINPPTRPA